MRVSLNNPVRRGIGDIVIPIFRIASRNNRLENYSLDSIDEIGNEFIVPQEAPIRRVYRTERSYFRPNTVRGRSGLAPKILDPDDILSYSSDQSQEESKLDRILPLMTFIAQPSRRHFINPELIDVDHMTYEQLLELEEAIGSVSKGLAPNQIAVIFPLIIEYTNI